MYDVTEKEIRVIACSGINSPTFSAFPINKGLNGKVVESKKIITMNDVANDPYYLTTFSSTNSEIIVPIIFQKSGKVVGTIDVENENKNASNNGDILFLEEYAKHLIDFWS